MVDVCDAPVISGVCDVAGDAAGALVSAPFDWLAQGMGHAAGWVFEAVWKVSPDSPGGWPGVRHSAACGHGRAGHAICCALRRVDGS